jgi:hypothetical protein
MVGDGGTSQHQGSVLDHDTGLLNKTIQVSNTPLIYEKASGDYVMEHITYIKDGLNKYMSYTQLMLKACKDKAGMDRFDGVSPLRKVDEPESGYTEANWTNTIPKSGPIQNQNTNRNTAEMH